VVGNVKTKIEIVLGDITKQDDIEAIVNAANTNLKMGGGVARAIRLAAGNEIQNECDKLAPIKPGEAVITKGYSLPNRYVIHCVGPRYGIDKPEEKILSSSYENAIRLAEKHSIKSIAFPAISTGIYGYPIEEATKVVASVIKKILPTSNIEKIRFVLFRKKDYDVYLKIFKMFNILFNIY
jgi:O-acetyl-ADP-ribose deacetylase (regulator of RNase III)